VFLLTRKVAPEIKTVEKIVEKVVVKQEFVDRIIYKDKVVNRVIEKRNGDKITERTIESDRTIDKSKTKEEIKTVDSSIITETNISRYHLSAAFGIDRVFSHATVAIRVHEKIPLYVGGGIARVGDSYKPIFSLGVSF
jgi:hypothetical protein